LRTSLAARGFAADSKLLDGIFFDEKTQLETLHSRFFAQRYKRQQRFFNFLMVAV
jgi:hypothetical protein